MPSLSGLPDVPCARCGRRGPIAWGELCPICQGERLVQAVKLSRWVALGSALVVGLYAVLRIPPQYRWYSAIAVAGIYLITRRIVTRLAMEFLPRDWGTDSPAGRRP
jgi:hypothetical protein